MLLLVFPPNLLINLASTYVDQQATQDGAFDFESFGAISIGLFVAGILVATSFGILAQGSLCYGVAQRYLGNPVTAGESLGYALERFGSLILASILITLGTMIGLIFFILPGIYLMLAWFIAVPALMIENLSASAALSRSRALTKGHLGLIIALGFILFILATSVGIAAALVPIPYLQAVVTSIINTLFGGLNAIVVTVLYFSARCKHENFDLELLTQTLDSPKQEMQSSL